MYYDLEEWYFPAFDSGISRKICSHRYLCLYVRWYVGYILGVKEWVFHLGLAFLRTCFVL